MTTEPEVPPLSVEDDFREQLAALCHEQWSGWMRYLFSRMTHGGLSMMDTGPPRAIEPPDYERWRRQAATQYADLSDADKDSDRKEADRFIVVIGATIAARDAEVAELLANAALLDSQLRDANRRASDLFNELGATQNAAAQERVELEAKLREAEGREAQLHEMRSLIIDAVSFTMESFNAGSASVGYGGLRSIIGIIEAHAPYALQSAQKENE